MKRNLFLALAACLVLAGCSRPRSLRVGFKNTTEQAILAEWIAQHLENRMQLQIERCPPLDSTLLAHQALLTGEIDLYPEYAGAAMAEILREDLPPDSRIAWERVRSQYLEQMRLEWFGPLGFKHRFILAVRGDAATKALRTVSDLERSEARWRVGLTGEFNSRRDGMRRLMTVYQIRMAAAPQVMTAAKSYDALRKNQIDVLAGFSTDGRLDGVALRPLQDDRSAFVGTDAGVVVRAGALAQFPGLRPAIEQLAGRMSEKTMHGLNSRAEAGEQPAAVARMLLEK